MNKNDCDLLEIILFVGIGLIIGRLTLGIP